MQKFESDVQMQKYLVLREVAEHAYQHNLDHCEEEIAEKLVPDAIKITHNTPEREKEIIKERVRIARGGTVENPNTIEVLPVACDRCPTGYRITNACRGCTSQKCILACPKKTVFKDEEGKAYIKQEGCIGCGKCAKACPYGAVVQLVRPCERACSIKAVQGNAEKVASINYDKCVSCGACSHACPFGAIMDKSYMTEAIDMIEHAKDGSYKMVAIVAPAIASQFDANLGQAITAIQQLGFDYVVEAAVGADMVAKKETIELAEKGFLTSSCCPAFVAYVQKHVPAMAEHISHNYSPMAEVAKYIKENAKSQVKNVFIGPCTAKKAEVRKEAVSPWVDCAITFEEMLGMVEAKSIDMKSLDETSWTDASPWGRKFGRSGGLTEAVLESVKEQGIDFEVKAEVCDGMEACKVAIMAAKNGKLDKNFIEGMMCLGGCIGGAASLTHEPRSRMKVDKYGASAENQEIETALERYKVQV